MGGYRWINMNVTRLPITPAASQTLKSIVTCRQGDLSTAVHITNDTATLSSFKGTNFILVMEDSLFKAVRFIFHCLMN